MSLGGVLGINPMGHFELGTITDVTFTPYRRPHGGRAARVHAGGTLTRTVADTAGGGSISRRNSGGTITDV